MFFVGKNVVYTQPLYYAVFKGFYLVNEFIQPQDIGFILDTTCVYSLALVFNLDSV
jgi:hypothetical protein